MIKNIISVFLTFFGYFYYLISKITPKIFFQSYVRCYCFSNGLISKILSFFVSFIRIRKQNKDDYLDDYNLNKNLNFNEINKTLSKKGYYRIPYKLDKEIVEKIIKFSLETDCTYLDDKKKKFISRFNLNKMKHEYVSSKYSYDESALFNFKPIKDILFDTNFTLIAKNYFGVKPCYSNLAMWWSPPRSKKPTYLSEEANESAQFFHFDLDRIKWLKLFIYLTDVDDQTGPHEYIQSSHKTFNKPKKILKKGYKRINEDEIRNYYEDDTIKRITGEKGTMFIGDTSCFHRGLPPLNKNRLILVIEYSNSMFGSEYSKIEIKDNNIVNYKNNLIINHKIN